MLPRAAVEAMIADARDLAPRGLGLWGTWTPEEGGRWAGAVGLLPVSGASLAAAPDLAGEVEPVVALEPRARGRGLAVEALGALVGHALGTLGLPGLVALVDEPNEASHRLMARAGFETDGWAEGPADGGGADALGERLQLVQGSRHEGGFCVPWLMASRELTPAPGPRMRWARRTAPSCRP